MTELGPLPPCPFIESGAHKIMYDREEGTTDVVLACIRCGIVRWTSTTPPDGTLDNLTPAQITARLGWSLREVRE